VPLPVQLIPVQVGEVGGLGDGKRLEHKPGKARVWRCQNCPAIFFCVVGCSFGGTRVFPTRGAASTVEDVRRPHCARGKY
jgi:hypothetical protein